MGKELPPAQEQSALAELARELLANRVVDGFSVVDTEPDLLGMVFQPVLFGALDGYTREQLGQLIVFAILGQDHVLPTAIDGWPMFSKCRIWLLLDWQKAVELYEKAKAAQDQILGTEG